MFGEVGRGGGYVVSGECGAEGFGLVGHGGGPFLAGGFGGFGRLRGFARFFGFGGGCIGEIEFCLNGSGFGAGGGVLEFGAEPADDAAFFFFGALGV